MSTEVDNDASRVWGAVSARLQETLKDSTFSTWFGRASGRRLLDETLEVAVPNAFTRAWIEGHFGSLVDAAVREVAPAPLAVRFLVDEDGDGRPHVEPETPATTVAPPAVAAPAARAELAPLAEAAVQQPTRSRDGSVLNPKYRFESFVIGSSNRFAHAAALAVAESPAQAYNPLFIYGSTGLGKTHLLQAIAHYVVSDRLGLTARYVTGEAFMNEFIDCLQGKRLEQFKARYRRTDVLLVDDIQFLAGRERIQEEFFHTFNTLHEAGGQIVLSSDRPPREIATLEERLRSRFEYGLITDIQPPDLETRIAILIKRAHRDGVHVGRDVLEQIAVRIRTNIRELEGALTRVAAFAALNGTPITADLVRDVLHDQYPEDARPVTVDEIQRVVADHFRVTVADLRSDRRTQNVVLPRQVAVYLCRELTDLSLAKIGERFGGRDHTTIHYAQSKIASRMRADRSLYNLVQDITARLRQEA